MRYIYLYQKKAESKHGNNFHKIVYLSRFEGIIKHKKQFLKETIMYNLSNVKVNETHICVLRRLENENRVKMDFIELKFKYQEQLMELEQMSRNDNRTVLDLQDYVKNSPLSELTKDFNFCRILGDSYQWEPCIPETTFYDYQAKLEEFDRDKNEYGKQYYIREMRESYYRKVQNHVVPYMMQTLYQELDDDPTVLAFSHRRVGWASPAFNLSDDFKVVYLTNFGYGMASYFYTQLYYKGIGILPYSEWVRYRKADTSDIIRYTRRHLLANSEWMKTMTFTADAYNAAIENPERFVKKYIMNEVEEMVSGLESILNSTVSYKVLDNFFHPGYGVYITGEELIRFKGEKISGALNFLDQLKTLVPICDDVSSYLKRIMNCNLSIVGELDAAIKKKQVILAEILEDLNENQPIWDILYKRFHLYLRMQNIIRKIVMKEADVANMNQSWVDSETEKRFKERHPEYNALEKEYDIMSEKINELNSRKFAAESFIKELQTYFDKIEAHKDYVIEDEFAA